MKSFLRVWNERDIEDIEKHLLVVGELSADCFACHEVGLDSSSKKCPACGVNFKYIGLRRKDPVNYLRRVKEEKTDIVFIDFEDFKKVISKRDARKLLDF